MKTTEQNKISRRINGVKSGSTSGMYWLPITFIAKTLAVSRILAFALSLGGVIWPNPSLLAASNLEEPKIEILPAKGNLRGVKATLVTRELSPDQAWAAITDYNHFSEFMPLTVNSEIMKSIGNTLWVDTTLKVAFTKIKYILRIDHQEQDAVRTASWVKESGDLKQIEGTWQVMRSESETSITYTSYVDAGTAIPGWIQDLLTKKSVPDLFHAVISRGKKTTVNNLRLSQRQ